MEQTHKINKIEIRNLRMEDYDQLAQSFTRVYADKDVFWTRAQIKKLIAIFPEGQIVTVADDKIVGCALSIIVDYDMVKGDHTYAKVTGNETFNTHNPNGNILYGIEVFIHPEYRGLRLARRMYDYRKELCEKLNLKAIMFGGRIPNYTSMPMRCVLRNTSRRFVCAKYTTLCLPSSSRTISTYVA